MGQKCTVIHTQDIKLDGLVYSGVVFRRGHGSELITDSIFQDGSKGGTAHSPQEEPDEVAHSPQRSPLSALRH